MAEHKPAFSHDAINRYLMEDDVSPNSVWLAVSQLLRRSGNACLIFDDTVLDKRHSFNIELVRRQYSGNEHGVVKGIGVVNCLYVNLDTGEHWKSTGGYMILRATARPNSTTCGTCSTMPAKSKTCRSAPS
jgi:hypothetical protein